MSYFTLDIFIARNFQICGKDCSGCFLGKYLKICTGATECRQRKRLGVGGGGGEGGKECRVRPAPPPRLLSPPCPGHDVWSQVDFPSGLVSFSPLVRCGLSLLFLVGETCPQLCGLGPLSSLLWSSVSSSGGRPGTALLVPISSAHSAAFPERLRVGPGREQALLSANRHPTGREGSRGSRTWPIPDVGEEFA